MCKNSFSCKLYFKLTIHINKYLYIFNFPSAEDDSETDSSEDKSTDSHDSDTTEPEKKQPAKKQPMRKQLRPATKSSARESGGGESTEHARSHGGKFQWWCWGLQM